MRQAILAASLALAACGSPSAPASAESVDAPVPMANNGDMQRLFTVDSVLAACTGGKLVIQAGATANSGGWGTPVLRRLGVDGGTVSYEVVADAPKGDAVTMMMQMFMLTHEEAELRGIKTVRIVAASNEMSAWPTGCPA